MMMLDTAKRRIVLIIFCTYTEAPQRDRPGLFTQIAFQKPFQNFLPCR